jgi:ubiquinol-cytochrome c reductase cytochrome c1 subunit
MFGRFSSRFTSSFGKGSRQATFAASPAVSNGAKLAALAGIVGGATALYAGTQVAEASFGYAEDCLSPAHYPWSHAKLWKSYDHAAVRRGFKVYQIIGSACHSMKFVYYRQLVNVAYSEKEMKEFAAEHDDYLADPNDEGEVLKRAGLLNDPLWKPWKNDKDARFNNNGALPPDLSLIVKARGGGEDYLFCLLTGYRDAPHGVTLAENMYYNIYFPGGQIAMPPPLAEGAVDYEDGTPNSVSQMTKDITEYLAWASSMEMDERHLMGVKSLALLGVMTGIFFYWKKSMWSYVKTRKFYSSIQRW